MDKILNVFCQHGASTAILVDAHPHIGTDKLPRVIENMRHTIIECGGEVHFETRMDALIIEKGKVKGIETQTGKTFLGPVILATGHSARDVYRWLAANKVPIEAKGIAVGVRLEHPAGLIDQIQYHNRNGRGKYHRRPNTVSSHRWKAGGIQLLHVSGRIYRTCRQRAGAGGGQWNVALQPWLPVEQLGHGGGDTAGRHHERRTVNDER